MFVSQLSLNHPFTCMMAGPSQSGKTTLLVNILKNNEILITPNPNRIVYCYKIYDKQIVQALSELQVEFNQGLPTLETFDKNISNLIILDDLMEQVVKDREMQDLFTVNSHHSNISVFFLTQNLFTQAKFSRTISLNCQYLILMNNPRDKQQIYTLGRQMYPTNPNYLVECYQDATRINYGYLFLDMSPSGDDKFRVQSNILPGETRIIYMQKT